MSPPFKLKIACATSQEQEENQVYLKTLPLPPFGSNGNAKNSITSQLNSLLIGNFPSRTAVHHCKVWKKRSDWEDKIDPLSVIH